MIYIDPIDQILMDFHASNHAENPEGKTELINYGVWGDKVRAVAFADFRSRMIARLQNEAIAEGLPEMLSVIQRVLETIEI